MKRFLSVLARPLAARAASVTGGFIGAWGTFDPALTSRVEAWVTAGVFIGVDLLVAALRDRKTQEGR